MHTGNTTGGQAKCIYTHAHSQTQQEVMTGERIKKSLAARGLRTSGPKVELLRRLHRALCVPTCSRFGDPAPAAAGGKEKGPPQANSIRAQPTCCCPNPSCQQPLTLKDTQVCVCP
jgi:hypothetical protein